MPSNTTYKPLHCSDFTADKLNFNGQGVLANAAGNANTNIDLTLTEDNLVQGLVLLAKIPTFGDYVSLQVLDSATGTYSGTANAVLNQFASKWYLRDDMQLQLECELEYPAKLLTGMVLRAIYTNTASAVVKVAVNYDFHKVLV